MNEEAIKRAKNLLDTRMKPVGSLGVLEDIVIKIAGIYGDIPKNIKKCHVVVSADNGVIEEGVSSCPIEYTRIVSEAMLNQIACIGIFCKRLGVEFNLIDVGIASPIPRDYPNLYRYNLMKGTKNFTKEPAMTREICEKAIQIGIDFIGAHKDEKIIFSNGEMGIGNTTTSSALLYSLTKADINDVVGVGGGLTDEKLMKKKKIIKDSCHKYNTFDMDIIDMIAHVGGLDIATMVGLYLGAVKYKKLMLVDGFISSVAALLATRIDENVKDYILLTHLSHEPGMKVVLSALGEEAFLHMNMRLGEGTGAVLAYPIIECALEMAFSMKTPVEVYKLFRSQ